MQREMQNSTYKDEMWRHLAEYKLSALGVARNGIWKKNRKEYSHILPFKYQQRNILEPYREEFWAYHEKKKKNIRLHSDFHHLSSSQAMCFNFFFPFLTDNKSHIQLLREVFPIDGIILDGQFEFVPDREEGTNFDFCIKTSSSKTLFELKLTEASFGTAKYDPSHKRKFDQRYATDLSEKFLPHACSCKVFLEHYQVMRNVWNLRSDTRDNLVCLIPRANTSLASDIEFMKRCLSDPYRSRVNIVYLEDAIRLVEKNFPDSAARMQRHFEMFKAKYLPNFR